MRRPHAFLISVSAGIAAGCAAAAVALAPVDGNRAGTAAGFAFFATMAGAGAALTLATAADALTPAARRR
jgi:glutamate synthase domain-containing protein 2